MRAVGALRRAVVYRAVAKEMKRILESRSGERREYEVMEVSLVRRDACCGLAAVWEDVPIGKKYEVLPETRRNDLLRCAGCGSVIETVQTHDLSKRMWCALPTRIFGIETQ